MKHIDEYLLSKKNQKTIIVDPKKGCTREEIAEWLGVNDFVKYDEIVHYPAVGETMYEIGPDNYERALQYWVALINVPKEANTVTTTKDQRIVFRPRSISCFRDVSGHVTEIKFEKAVELAKQVIENPNKAIKL